MELPKAGGEERRKKGICRDHIRDLGMTFFLLSYIFVGGWGGMGGFRRRGEKGVKMSEA